MAISILNIDPSHGSIGHAVDKAIEIIFDQPLDTSTLTADNIFLSASSQEHISGPYYPINLNTQFVDSAFQEPGYEGIVKATNIISFLDTSSSPLSSTYVDTAGTGGYYTKVVVKQSRHLFPNTEYTLHIAGQQYTSVPTGVSERTVFDPIANGANSGTETFYSVGGYSGTANGTFTIQISSEGQVGEGYYVWKFNNSSFSKPRVLNARKNLLAHGVGVAFMPEGTYVAGDIYTFLVKPAVYLSGIAHVNFVTGNYGETVDLTNLTATHISSNATYLPNTYSNSQSLFVKYTISKNYSQISNSASNVEFHFNKVLDTSSLDTNGIEIYVGSPNGIECGTIADTSYNPNYVEVSGTKLTVYFENT